jgi:alkylation response protein AidB-like acyl-CoA dehydrogenase
MSKLDVDREQELFSLPADVRELKARAHAFVQREIWPFEEQVARTEAIDTAALSALRHKARAEGFSMLNMPERLGGKDLPMLALVGIEEEAGWATNGLGFIVADRGPRELVEIATADQIQRFVAPVLQTETREAWAITEPGAGSDVSAISTRAVKDGSDWDLNGEKWFVTDADKA